jgi:hypothetical protein
MQLLEELCSHGCPGTRAAVLEQLAGGKADPETLEVTNVLVSIPPEFSPGKTEALGLLIACRSQAVLELNAGSYCV